MSTKKMKTKGVPSEIDVHVGKRLRVRRSLLGYSQEKLASLVGLTFQQIQKYERGTNRVSAGRLYELSQILDVPVTYFFDKISAQSNDDGKIVYGMSDNEQEGFASEESEFSDIMSEKETLELIRVYYSVKDAQKRKDIVKFIKSMAERVA